MEIQYPLIIFTVLQRLGLGTYIILVLTVWLAGIDISFSVLALIAMLLLGIGVLASLAHLGRPDRVFNSFANTKSALSWEGILALLTGIFLLLNALEAMISYSPAVINTIKVLAAFSALVFLFTTGKIYWLKTRPAWDTPLVIIIFLFSALALGFAGAYFWLLLAGKGIPQGFLLCMTCVFLCTWCFQIIYLSYLRKLNCQREFSAGKSAIMVCVGGWFFGEVIAPVLLAVVISTLGHEIWTGILMMISFLIGLAFWQSGVFLVADQAPFFPEM